VIGDDPFVSDTDSVLDPQDRAYVEQIDDAELRDVVVASLRRHRRPERLAAGDPMPDAVLHPADGGEPVALRSLLTGRPALLVFGSFT